MNGTRRFGAALAAACVMGLAAVAAGGTLDVDWHTIDGGGGVSSGGEWTCAGTIGQHDAGTMSGGALALLGGFWTGGESGPPCPEDLDGSGAVDFGDILVLLSTWGDSGGPGDLDGSGTVDFGDIVVVLSAWGDCP